MSVAGRKLCLTLDSQATRKMVDYRISFALEMFSLYHTLNESKG